MICSGLGCRTGYFAWLHKPLYDRAEEDARLLQLIRAFASEERARAQYSQTKSDILAKM
jgi:hypothetical protein